MCPISMVGELVARRPSGRRALQDPDDKNQDYIFLQFLFKNVKYMAKIGY